MQASFDSSPGIAAYPCVPALSEALKFTVADTALKAGLHSPPEPPFPAIPQLRDYQAESVERLRQRFAARSKRLLFVLPTGGGKTVIFSYIVANAIKRGKRVLIVVHRIELLEQVADALRQFGIEAGFIAPGRPTTDKPVQIAMVQTLARRLNSGGTFDLVVIDECHHATAGQYRKVLDAFPQAKVLGVTATPRRTDGTGLGDVFDDMVVGPSMHDLIGDGWLSPYTVFVPPDAQIDTSRVQVRCGDFDKNELADAARQQVLVGNALTHYRTHSANARAIAFCVSIDHARRVAAAFSNAGYSAAHLDGSMGLKDRQALVSSFREGTLRILTSCDVLGEGFDVPCIETAILLRPTMSEIVYLQQIGRALRSAPGKQRAIILDHAGNSLRHGLPDSDWNWSLRGRAKAHRTSAAATAPQVIVCRECSFAFPVPRRECPNCGAEHEKAASRQVREIEGELVEFDKQRSEFLSRLPYRKQLQACETAEDFKNMARERGYKPGWAIRAVAERFDMDLGDAAEFLGYRRGFVQRLRRAA